MMQSVHIWPIHRAWCYEELNDSKTNQLFTGTTTKSSDQYWHQLMPKLLFNISIIPIHLGCIPKNMWCLFTWLVLCPPKHITTKKKKISTVTCTFTVHHIHTLNMTRHFWSINDTAPSLTIWFWDSDKCKENPLQSLTRPSAQMILTAKCRRPKCLLRDS